MDFTLEKNILCTYMRINDIGGNNKGNDIFFVCVIVPWCLLGCSENAMNIDEQEVKILIDS